MDRDQLIEQLIEALGVWQDQRDIHRKWNETNDEIARVARAHGQIPRLINRPSTKPLVDSVLAIDDILARIKDSKSLSSLS